jgi:mRNA-degrading endonuclease RelE of RelBE toxin-antitoxin system
MSKSSQIYNKRFTRTFEKQLRKIRDVVRVKRIKEEVDEIVENPYRKIDFGAGRWRGKRKERIGDDRIMFTVCEQCKKEGHKKFNQCLDCANTPTNMVTFWEVIEGHKY